MAVVARRHKSGVVYWVATSHPGGKHWERSGRDKRAAERLDAQRRREVKAGTFSPVAASSGSHVRTYLAGWLAARTVRTVETERALVRDFVLCRDWFAALPLRDVRPRHLVQLVAELKGAERARGGPLSPKSVSNILGILRTAFRDAEIAELVDVNPVVLPRGTLTRKGKAREAYSEDQARTALVGAGDPSRAVFAALALYTGMREGEVCGRRWRDLEASRPLAALTVSTQYADQPLKTDNPRRVPVHPELMRILAWWWSRGFELAHRRPPTLDDWIVPRSVDADRCHSKASAYKAWRRGLDRAGVVNLSLHSTRHTFLTLARRGGARGEVIERVTHNASGTMVDHYTHWAWQPLCEAVACFPALLPVDSPVDSLWIRVVSARETGSSSWTRNRGGSEETAESGGNAPPFYVAPDPAFLRGFPHLAAEVDARQPLPRALARALIAGPAPHVVELAEAYRAVLAGDEPATLRGLARCAAELLEGRHVG